MKGNISNYYISLDLGTNSVGWSAFKEDLTLLRINGKHTWGTRIFTDAETAESTRMLRGSRRRYERRRERIKLLRELMSKSINEKDDCFFQRLDNSFLLNVKYDEEFGRDNLYNLFDGDFTDKEFYYNFKTIYHLRNHLMNSDKKEDIRLIYLAIHHILKYRGNFLHEEDAIDIKGEGLNKSLDEFFEEYDRIIQIDNAGNDDIFSFGNGVDSSVFFENLQNKKLRKGERIDLLTALWKNNETYKNKAKELSKLLLGYKSDFSILFNEPISEGKDKKEYCLSFSDGKYEEEIENIISLFGDDKFGLIEKLHGIYYTVIFQKIIGNGNTYLSQGMIQKYEKHAKDLEMLKNLLRPFPEKYDSMFKSPRNKTKREKIKTMTYSYTAYVKTQTKRTQYDKTIDRKEFDKKFFESLKKILEELPNSENKNKALIDIENNDFLQKLNTVDNASIPYQVNKTELEIILDKQAKFYPELQENRDKIISILTFRRPYSVGVLNYNSKRFSWIDEEHAPKERVYPWNFYDVVDVDYASEQFIKKMTGHCSYFKDEYVLPLNSLLYQKYIVLNELNNIKIITDGVSFERKLTKEEKQSVFNNLFKKKLTVSANELRIYLKKHFDVNINKKEDVKGLSDGNKFIGKLSAYNVLNKIGLNPDENESLCEEIIKDLTIFKDKKIRARVFNKLIHSNDFMAKLISSNNDLMSKLLKLNFDGWGRLSAKVLIGIKNHENKSVLDVLYEESYNFMEIIFDKGPVGFKEQIIDVNKEKIDKVTYDIVDDLYLSPSVKRTVWQALCVVKEIVKITGKQPLGIYLESTRSDDKSKRTISRLEKLKMLYESIEKDNLQELKDSNGNILKNIDDEKLKDDMVYLYCLQHGKSLYSQEKLDLNCLSQTCEIDHIIPRNLIKDDSIENRVLVLKGENQRKQGTPVLPYEIRKKMAGYWKFLYSHGLMGKKKYNNLLMEELTPDKLEKFIARQLVETNQSVKAVRDLFKQIYSQSDVELVKAGISSTLREANASEGLLNFYKLRDLNDMHHAKDAYLAGVIAVFTRKIYPVWGADSFAKGCKQLFDESNSKISSFIINRMRYGVVVDAMKYADNIDYVDVSGEKLDWNNCYNNILKTMDYNDCLVTRKTEINANGAFWKATIISPAKKTGNLPLRMFTTRSGVKKFLPTEKYGNYTNENKSYFVNVTYKKGKRIKTQLLGVPAIIAALSNNNKEAIKSYFDDFCKSQLKGEFISVDDRIIRIYQLIKMQNQLCYITSDSELWTAAQLVVDKKYNRMLYCIAHPKKKITINENQTTSTISFITGRDIFEAQMQDFLYCLVEKIEKFYPFYATISANIKKYLDNGSFANLPYYDDEKHIDKLTCVSNILSLTAAKSKRVDLSKYPDINGEVGTLGSSSCGRISGKTIYNDQVDWIDYSITGLYSSILKAKEGV